MKCKHCGDDLSISVYNQERTMKSCPNCSQANQEYHVFHSYPSAFGTTNLRSSNNSPEGAQSYCTSCRAKHSPSSGILCCDIDS